MIRGAALAGFWCAAFLAHAAAAQTPKIGFAAGGEGLALSPSDIASVDVSGEGDEAVLTARLAPKATTAFEAFTRNHLGERITLEICGRELMNPTAQAPVSSGLIRMPPRERADADALAKVLRGEADCASLPW